MYYGFGKFIHVIPFAILLVIGKVIGYLYDKKVNAIKQTPVKIEYIVMRDGKKCKIEEVDIVVGDVIYLKAGIRVPVDGIFVSGNSLIIDESEVLGETQKSIKKPLGK